MHTLSRSARSIFAPVLNSLRSRSPLLNDDEYFGSVGGGIGRAAIAGFSWFLLALWMLAVGCAILLVKLAIYAPKYQSNWLIDNVFLKKNLIEFDEPVAHRIRQIILEMTKIHNKTYMVALDWKWEL